MIILIQPWTIINVYYAQGQASDPKLLLGNTIALNRRVDFKQSEKIVHDILFARIYKMLLTKDLRHRVKYFLSSLLCACGHHGIYIVYSSHS